MPYYPGAGQTWSNYYNKHPQVTSPSPPAPLTLINTMRGGVPGVSVSNTNSGGASGNTFNAVVIGSGGTIVYSAAQAIHGNPVSILCQTTTSNASSLAWNSNSITQTQYQMWFCQYLLFPSLPVASTRIYTTSATGLAGGTSRFVVTTAGTIQLQNAAGSTVATTTNSVTIGQWCRIEGFTQASQGNGLIEVKIFAGHDDLVPLETKTSALTDAGPGTNNTLFGPNAGAVNQGPYYIGFAGVTNTGYMGPAPITPFIPQLEAMPGETWQKSYQHRQSTYLTIPDAYVGAPPANVNVSSPADNTVFVSPTTSPANVGVSGQSDNSLSVTLTGAVSGVSVSSPADNTVAEFVLGQTASVSSAAVPGSLLVNVGGTSSAVSTSAPAGNIDETVIGAAASVTVSGIAGSVAASVPGVTGTISVSAIPGIIGQQNINIFGPPATVTVMAPSGEVTLEPVGTWWRVYPSYRSYPA